MQDLVKRYFWVIGAVSVLVCAVFAAKATNHIVEAKFLGDPDHAPRVASLSPAPVHEMKPTRSKDGSAFATRDMFCSDCAPAPVVASGDPSSISPTSLPLQLLATSVAGDPASVMSYATIINTENQKQGSYSIGDPIPGATGALKAIHYQFVDFENNGHLERLALNGANVPPPTPAPPPPVATDGEPKDEMQAAVDAGIKKTGDNTYEIDKSLVDKVLANPMAVAKGARVVPAVKDGKPDGFKLYAIRPSSVYAKLGLTNGDTLQSINGFELTSADKALEAYTKLREATSLQVDITRRGKPMTLKYGIK